MKSTTRWMIGTLVITLGLTSALSAATYMNAGVTYDTLREQDAVNILDGYPATWGGDNTRIGNGASGVALNMINGSMLSTPLFYVGSSTASQNCTTLIDNATVNASGFTGVGVNTSWGDAGGNNNSLTIQNGGRLISSATTASNHNYIGAGNAAGNSVLLTGSGSLYQCNRMLRISGTGNTLEIQNGAMGAFCRPTDNDGGVDTTGEDGYVKLGGGYLVTGSRGDGGAPVPLSRLQLWTGTEWASVDSLTPQELDDLGYAHTVATNEAHFNELTGGVYTDVASSYQYDLQKAIHVYSVPVPEPTTMVLLSMGALALIRRRRK